MGRPPQPHYETTTYDELTPEGTPARLRFVPQGFAEFVELQRELADEELELRSPGGEDDFSETLFELAAAVAHVLARHQDHHASEAFFASAATTLSLQRHGRRLAYLSDPGLSATGVVALTVPEGRSGELAAGLALQSTAVGEDKPQHYETLAAREVDALWNAILPNETTQPISYANLNVVSVFGVDLGLEIGEAIAIASPDQTDAPHPYRVVSVVEEASEGVTAIGLDGSLPADFNPSKWTLWAKPERTRRLFGWDASPERFPATALRWTSVSDVITSEVYPDYEWVLDYADEQMTGSDLHVFLAEPLTAPLTGPIIATLSGALSGWAVVANSHYDVSVVFRAQHQATVTLFNENNQPDPQPYPVIHAITAPSAAIMLGDQQSIAARSQFDPRTQLLTDFELALSFVTSEPNTQTIVAGDTLVLDGSYALVPGMLIVLLRPSDADASVAKLDRVEDVDGKTHIRFSLTGGSSSGVSEWTLGDLQILANVVPVSHGKTRVEVLGDSDGITSHQRFTLAKPYVTQLLVGDGSDGAAPALIVRVADVEWTRVDDFGDSGPNDRHYRVELDDAQKMSVIFGDGRKGAVPSKGQRHIVAEYRVGLGVAGNIDAGRLTKLAGANALVEAVNNPVEIAGGTEPADDDALRREATQYVQTFDRAVSAADHAALALLYPGVARANARYSLTEGVVLVVADADGDPLTDASTLAAFLQARRDQSCKLTLREPEAIAVYIELALELDPAYQSQLVEDAVRAALLEQFGFAGREFGQAAHLSQIYATLADVAGVDRARVSHFALTSSDPVTKLNDVLIVDVHQWLELDAANLSLTTTTTETA